ncbi:hypothetical protein NX801_26850 [Streptomyces sp. LP05-1]|uniref:LigA protein n=1 Tax=Streptomyces pyxinae TaxID=2970734 RepID=A0ABT2CR77_9ACTN|nr:hypothetical protein [Streptomyces sp. LP05-1]MCS0639196.1 hypothetical protein [Streptomyces sp. LP05-1]
MTEEPVYDRAEPSGAVRLVEYHLGVLGLAPVYELRGDGLRHRVLPEGKGWCHAVAVSEAAWPVDAELCVAVRWVPDEAYRRDPATGRVPLGAVAHWSERLMATVAALEAAGFLAEPAGRPQTPYHHPGADLLVYRMRPGDGTDRPPVRAWAPAEPARPNHVKPVFTAGDESPEREVERLLRSEGLSRSSPDRNARFEGANSCLLRPAPAVEWPPDAAVCTAIRWDPEPGYRRRPDGTVPESAGGHWDRCTALVTRVLRAAGYEVRRPRRPWCPERDDCVVLLAHRTIAPGTPVPPEALAGAGWPAALPPPSWPPTGRPSCWAM